MKQYFYIVMHTYSSDDMQLDRIFLQESDAITFGRRLATKNKEFSVVLYKQLIARTAKVEFVKVLKPF